MAQRGQSQLTIRGIAVPRRRFTRWAVLYFLVFFCLPLLTLCLAIDSAFYYLFFR